MKPIIGIPKKGDNESFYAMLDSLITSTDYFDEIVIATPDDIEFTHPDFKHKIKFIKKDFKTPLEAYNCLFDYAKEKKKDLFLTQTDVLFPKLYKRDWLQIFSQIAQDEGIGAVTSLNGGGISGSDYVEGMFWLGGWTTLIPYRTLVKVGKFDETFPLSAYGVDIDFSYRLQKSGLQIIRYNYWTDHHMMNERLHDNDPDTEIHKQECAKYFRKKWKINTPLNVADK